MHPRNRKLLTITNLVYSCGIVILLLKIKSRNLALPPLTQDEYFFENDDIITETKTKSRIPHIIHQSYKSFETVPKVWAETTSRWKSLHPEYEYKFWSDEDNRNLIKSHYRWFLSTYDSYPAPIQRADAARYFAVLRYGGIYADMDILPIRSVSPLLDRLSSDGSTDDKEMLVAETYNLGLTNALFAAVPNSTVLERFVRELPLHTKPLHGFESFNPHFGVLLSTGPTRLWIFLNNYRDKILTINPAGWGQCHQCRQKQCIPQKGSFFQTTKGGSWHKWDTRIMNFVFCHVHLIVWAAICAILYLGQRFYHRQNGTNQSELCIPIDKYDSGEPISVDSYQYKDVDGKKRRWKWNLLLPTTPGSFEQLLFHLKFLLSKYQFEVFCVITFILLI